MASVITSSCKNPNKSIALSNSDSIINGFKKAKESGVQIEGQFMRIETLNEKESNLYLKLNSDSIVAFRTIMPLDSNDINRLVTRLKQTEVKISKYPQLATKM